MVMSWFKFGVRAYAARQRGFFEVSTSTSIFRRMSQEYVVYQRHGIEVLKLFKSSRCIVSCISCNIVVKETQTMIAAVTRAHVLSRLAWSY